MTKDHCTLSRRSFLSSAILLSAQSLALAQAGSEHRDQRISGVRVGSPRIIPHNAGDIWVAAWADDGNLYTPSNDTGGFHGEEMMIKLLPELSAQQKKRILQEDETVWNELTPAQITRLEKEAPSGTFAFNRLQGASALDLDGVTINWMREFTRQDLVKEVLNENKDKIKVGADGATWKTRGCTFIDGALYLVIARHTYGEISGDPKLRETSMNASIIKSSDYGKTWTRSADENLRQPMFPGTRFATPYFIEYGRSGTVDGADRYIYAISNNGFWDNGDRLILGRVPRSRIGLLNPADWEFFKSGDGAHDSSWSRDAATAKPIIEDPGKLGQTGAVYLPHRQRYMMVCWYYTGGSAKAKVKGGGTETVWNFYESPKPWGPWTRIGSRTWSPQGYYCPAICPKFQSKDRVYVFTTGYWRDAKLYKLTVVPVDFT